MLAAYARLLTRPGVAHVLVVGLLIKLGVPVFSLALLLTSVDELGSYANAGLVLTGHALALAAFAPIAGRMADRAGHRTTLAVYLALHSVAYAALVIALVVPSSHLAGMTAAAVLLGATTPPAGAVIRGAWPGLVPVDLLPSAFAADNAANELAFILGPLLVPSLTTLMPSRIVVLTAGGAVLVGVALLLTSPAVRVDMPTPAVDRSRQTRLSTLLGPLTDRQPRTLLVISTAGAFSFGCVRIAAVAAAAATGPAASAGLLLGLFSAGSLVGTLGYGLGARMRRPLALLAVLSLLEAAALFGVRLAGPPLALAVALFVTGLVAGPRDALVPDLLTERTRPQHRTEIFTWLNTVMWVGYALGVMFAGQITGTGEDGGPAFGAAAAVAALVAVIATIADRAPTRPDRRAIT